MNEISSHERRVLFHLLKYPEHVTEVEEELTQEHFQDASCQWAFTLLIYWRHQIGYNLTLDSALEQISSRVSDPEIRQRITALLIGLMDFQNSTRADLEHAVAEIKRQFRSRRVMEITQGLAEKLARSGGEADIAADLHALFETTNPEARGTIRNTKGGAEEYARRYELAKAGGVVPGLPLGFSRIDELTGGMRKKDFYVLAGFTGEGKTTLAKAITYNVAAAGGRVLYVQLEMDEEDIFLSLYARRSHELAKKVGRGLRPLPIRDIRAGKLNETQEKLYTLARRDVDAFDILVWVPGDASMSDIRRRIAVEQLYKPVDLVVVDYFSLCRPERNRFSDREEGIDIMRSAKRLARSQNIRLLGLHQISRDGRAAAVQLGYYELNHLAQTSEVERNTDAVLWTLLTEDMRMSNELRFGMMKNRSGPPLTDGYHLFVDFASAIATEHMETATKAADFFAKFMP